MKGFQEVQETYQKKGYTYIRTRNPNRTALGEVLSCLEGGEASLIFASGMGAITSTLLAILEPATTSSATRTSMARHSVS